MPSFEQIMWLPICAALTGVGVVAAFFALRRRGATAGLRLLGWAVLPMAVYLTGLARFLYTVVAEAVRWVGKFVFSPTVWTGVALFGVAFVLLGTAGIMRRRKVGAAGEDKASKSAKPAKQAKPAQAAKPDTKQPAEQKSAKVQDKPKQVGKGEPADDPLAGLEDIDEILKRRGIE